MDKYNKNKVMYREDYDRANAQERTSDDVFSKPIRAGKRTYFFDVKSTRGNNDYYLTLTESKRRQERDGSFTYDKHKIFLYKEDFQKFQEGLEEVINFIKGKLDEEGIKIEAREYEPRKFDNTPKTEEKSSEDNFSDVNFEEL